MVSLSSELITQKVSEEEFVIIEDHDCKNILIFILS